MRIDEMFLGIQGEGIESGLVTLFIRTFGCNLGCSWCDTKQKKGKEIGVKDILKKCESFGNKRVCITGGEPLIQKQDCIKLMNLLIKKRFKILIETNGSLDISGLPKKAVVSLDIKCPSSKEDKRILIKNLNLIRKKDQVKFVIADKKDYEFAKRFVQEYNLIGKTGVVFQPEYNSGFDKRLLKSILKDKLDVRLGFQLHKICWKDNWSKK